jgi:putative SOS response-associated peptidase YedK
MCCRYVTGTGIYELVVEELGLTETTAPRFPAMDVNPGNTVPVITAGETVPVFLEASWGFPKEGSPIINARSESLLARPSFASSFEARRCLIPASGFYEWDEGKNKVLFTLPDGKIIYLAAIWNFLDDVYRFVVLTTDANASMSPVHDRMPVMIGAAEAKDWLFDFEKAKDMISKEMPLLSLKREEEQLSFL